MWEFENDGQDRPDPKASLPRSFGASQRQLQQRIPQQLTPVSSRDRRSLRSTHSAFKESRRSSRNEIKATQLAAHPTRSRKAHAIKEARRSQPLEPLQRRKTWFSLPFQMFAPLVRTGRRRVASQPSNLKPTGVSHSQERRLSVVMPPGNSVSERHPNRSSRLKASSELRSTKPLAGKLESLKPRREATSSRPRTPSGLAVLYGTRLLILGVGVGVLAGTILSVWDPARQFATGGQPEKTEKVATAPSQPALPTLELSEEIAPLKAQIQAAIAPLTQLTPGVMVVDLDTHAFLDVNASTAFAAASTIKFPVLVAFFQDVDAGKIRLNEMLTMRQDLIATESGDLQYQPPGSQFLALEVVTKMITVSDNTATNMIIDRLGGKEVLNQRFQAWGLTNTMIQNPLPDLNGTNTSSPKDMTTLMSMVNSGQMMSSRSQERMLDIMRHVITDSLLPRGLGDGATIAHKTGDIGSMVGDTGMVDMPTGKRYLISVLVKRPFNDDRAQNLIRRISTLTYQYFEQSSKPVQASPDPAQTSPSAASPTPASSSPLPNAEGESLRRF